MTSAVLESTMAALAAYQGLQRLRQIRSGNPYHDQDGKFAHGPGGHGKHHAKRVRRRERRKKNLEALRKEYHQDIKEYRDQHKEEGRDLIADQKKEWKSLIKDQKKEWHDKRERLKARKALVREHRADIADLKIAHAKEHSELLRDHAHELKHADPEDHADLKSSHLEEIEELRETHARQRSELRGQHSDAIHGHKEQERKERQELREEHQRNREALKGDHVEQRTEHREGWKLTKSDLIEGYRQELKETFPRAKSKKTGESKWSDRRSFMASGGGLQRLRLTRAEGNPNHKGSGPDGGQFTSGPGGGGGKAPGKHHAKNKRRAERKKLLNKLHKEARGKLEKIRKGHAVEKSKLRAAQRKESGSSDKHRGERKDLAERHKNELRQTVAEIKSDVRDKIGKHDAKAEASIKSEGRLAKVAGYKDARAKAIGELHAKQREERKEFQKDYRDDLKNVSDRYRDPLKEEHQETRRLLKESRDEHSKKRSEIVKDFGDRYREDKKYNTEQANNQAMESAVMASRERRIYDKRMAKALEAGDKKSQEYWGKKFNDAKTQHDERLAEIRNKLEAENTKDKQRYIKLANNEIQSLNDRYQDEKASIHHESAKVKAALRKDRNKEYDEIHKYNEVSSRENRQAWRTERRDVINQVREKTGFKPTRSFRASGGGVIGGSPDLERPRTALDRRGVARTPERLSKSVTTKASNAESILAYCLKRLGWTVKWLANKLTGKQHLRLLEYVRQYGRRWLRHEAEGLFRHYGNQNQPVKRTCGDFSDGIQGNGEGLRGDIRHDFPGMDRSLSGDIASAVSRFFRRARSFVHELIISGAMALKGPDPLSPDEVQLLDQAAKAQHEFLNRFEQEVLANPPYALPQDAFATVTQIVEGPPMTGPQFVARAEQYANSAWQSSQRVNRQNVVSTGVMKLERRVLGHPKTEHCSDCPPIAAMGWQPIGTLPAIGDSECTWLCLCHFEYQDGPNGQPHVTATKPTQRPRRKIVLKTTPNTNYKKIQRPPTKEEIDVEIDKYLKGQPSRITIAPPGTPPVVPGTINPREGGGWKDLEGKPVDYTPSPVTPPETPEGYFVI